MSDTVPIAYDALLDAMTDLVFLLDQDEKIVHINTSAEAFFGISRDDLAGQNLDSNALRKRLGIQRFLIGSEQSEVEVADLQGKTHPIEMNRCMVTGQDNQAQGTLITLHDVTKYQEAAHTSEALMYTVAHDLKLRIHKVIAFAELLRQELDSLSKQEINDALEDIRTAVFTVSELADDLLLRARIFSGGEVSMIPLAMREIVQAALARDRNHPGRIGVTVNISETWAAALGHAPWVEEVWWQLISFAGKYGGSPSVITLGSDPASVGLVRFWMRDNGKHLEETERRRLFSMPLGIGLVRDIVGRMGGEVGIESETGKGNLFYFTLPSVLFMPPTQL